MIVIRCPQWHKIVKKHHFIMLWRNGFSKVDLQKINTLYNCPGFEHTGGGHGGGVVTTTQPPVKPDMACKDTHK